MKDVEITLKLIKIYGLGVFRFLLYFHFLYVSALLLTDLGYHVCAVI